MRVVVPYTSIHPITDHALRELAPEAERVRVTGTLGYSQLLTELWRDGDTSRYSALVSKRLCGEATPPGSIRGAGGTSSCLGYTFGNMFGYTIWT